VHVRHRTYDVCTARCTLCRCGEGSVYQEKEGGRRVREEGKVSEEGREEDEWEGRVRDHEGGE
jgi:hypothetical protein